MDFYYLKYIKIRGSIETNVNLSFRENHGDRNIHSKLTYLMF